MLVQPRGRTPIYSCSGSMKSLFEFQIKLLSSWNRIFSAERGFVAVHTDGKKGYSLSNWPELEAKELNPEDGIIVRVNKNTEYRMDQEDNEDYYNKMVTEFEKMKDWKDGVTKALWIVFTSLVGIVGYIISGVM